MNRDENKLFENLFERSKWVKQENGAVDDLVARDYANNSGAAHIRFKEEEARWKEVPAQYGLFNPEQRIAEAETYDFNRMFEPSPWLTQQNGAENSRDGTIPAHIRFKEEEARWNALPEHIRIKEEKEARWDAKYKQPKFKDIDNFLEESRHKDAWTKKYSRNPGIVPVSDEVKYARIISDNIDSNPELAKSVYRQAKAEWSFKTNASPEQVVIFNGKNATLYEGGKVVKSWKGVSGKKGHQTKEFQNVRNVGPLPEGAYMARFDDYQKMGAFDWVIGDASKIPNLAGVKFGAWPGGDYAWGHQRVWLTPAENTDTLGRDAFSIHGGLISGSAGCIDLTGRMPDFAKWFTKNGRDVTVVVSYE